MPAAVYLHPDFVNGNHRSSKYADFQALSTDEAAAIFDYFVGPVQDGKKLAGKNKPSWEDDAGREYRDRHGYKAQQLWHCHIGPYNSPGIMQPVRIKNLEGCTAGPVVHYRWMDYAKTELIIIAYSPEHVPFPLPREAPGLLYKRAGIIIKSRLIKAPSRS